MGKNNFYVTTPIYYGTAKPHLGSLYSTLIADVVARWQKLLLKDTYFLTGTDEHGQKIMQAAQKVGKTPKEFVDSFIAAYQETWQTYHIEYQQFIRTTDPRHIKGVQELITLLMDKGDIYKDSYEGWYCTPCETYVTAGENEKNPPCPSCGRETVAVSEESYFFKLSKYQDRILAWLTENADIIQPRERAQEVIRFVESGLKDLSISRTTISWGVPFPHDPEHVVYVWVDALCNYITAVGYGDPAEADMFKKWWPCNLHVLGKDIVRFHAVYWPAMLMAADLALPKKLLVHGWIQVNKQKMSKSLGNVVDPMELAQHYGADEVRYYLLRMLPINTDGDFSTGDLEQRISSDLANDLGNLLHRMVSLAERYSMHTITPPKTWHKEALDLADEAYNVLEEYEEHMANYEFHHALGRLWRFINKVNAYFHEQEPWKKAKKDMALFEEIISATCHSLHIIGVLLWPIMPEKMIQLLQIIGHPFNREKDSIESLELSNWHKTFTLSKSAPLFNKIQEPIVDEKIKEPSMPVQDESYITIEDVMKVELRVGLITKAESVPNSDKLIKMQVDLGPIGMRQIFSGIRKWYHPEDLVGKQGLFITNLKPRKMLGDESQGMMILAEDEKGMPRIVSPEGAVPNGTRLK